MARLAKGVRLATPALPGVVNSSMSCSEGTSGDNSSTLFWCVWAWGLQMGECCTSSRIVGDMLYFCVDEPSKPFFYSWMDITFVMKGAEGLAAITSQSCFAAHFLSIINIYVSPGTTDIYEASIDNA